MNRFKNISFIYLLIIVPIFQLNCNTKGVANGENRTGKVISNPLLRSINEENNFLYLYYLDSKIRQGGTQMGAVFEIIDRENIYSYFIVKYSYFVTIVKSVVLKKSDKQEIFDTYIQTDFDTFKKWDKSQYSHAMFKDLIIRENQKTLLFMRHDYFAVSGDRSNMEENKLFISNLFTNYLRVLTLGDTSLNYIDVNTDM